MKKRVLMFVMASAMLFTGCKKEESSDLSDVLVGEWTLEMYVPATKGAMIGSEPVSILISFYENKRFKLEQKVGQAFTEYFDGTWSLDGTVLSGIYSDNKPWGSKYDISFRDNNNVLEMKTVATQESYIYQRIIPDKE